MIDVEKLYLEAMKARENSYSPYSNFAVGACVLTKDGKYIHGANIENSSYPLSCCAERTCLFTAMNLGYKKDDFVAFALVADTDEPTSPCGACRQVISELLNKNTPIYMFNVKKDMKLTNIEELLPFCFSGDDLK